MEAVREYILGIGAAAMICAITMAIAGKGKLQPMLKLICGLILTFTVVRPVLAFSAGDFSMLLGDCRKAGEEAAREGQKIAEDALTAGIRQQTEAYILEKAAQMGLELRAEVSLSGTAPPVPQAVTIRGSLSPYERNRLLWMLREDLGIGEENVQWIPDS